MPALLLLLYAAYLYYIALSSFVGYFFIFGSKKRFMYTIQYDYKVNLGNIRVLCKKKGITVKELAKRVGISENGLSRVIKKNSIVFGSLVRICVELGCPMEFFLLELGQAVDHSDNKLDKGRIRELEGEVEKLKEVIVELNKKLYK